MKFRPQRGSLEDAMKEVAEIPATLEALTAHLNNTLGLSNYKVYSQAVRVRPYGYDERIKWHTYIVTINGNAIGFTNSEVPGAD